MISTTTTTGWAIRRKTVGDYYYCFYDYPIFTDSREDIDVFINRASAEQLLTEHHGFADCEVVSLTRTVTVEIGEAET